MQTKGRDKDEARVAEGGLQMDTRLVSVEALAAEVTLRLLRGAATDMADVLSNGVFL